MDKKELLTKLTNALREGEHLYESDYFDTKYFVASQHILFNGNNVDNWPFFLKRQVNNEEVAFTPDILKLSDEEIGKIFRKNVIKHNNYEPIYLDECFYTRFNVDEENGKVEFEIVGGGDEQPCARFLVTYYAAENKFVASTDEDSLSSIPYDGKDKAEKLIKQYIVDYVYN